jgi:hypothetical protein
VPHGTPDWWGESPTATVHQVTDVGELAVRLGSPVSYDRRGNVVWFDTFEDGLGKWVSGTAGTGASVFVTSKDALQGAYSAQLVGGSDGLMNAQVARILFSPVLGGVGVEVSFELAGLADEVDILATHYDGATGYRYHVRWVRATSDFEYLDSAGVWQDIDANKPLIATTAAWHTMKVVFNTSTEKYMRAMLDDEEYPLVGIAPQTTVSAVEPTINLVLRAYSSAGLNHYARIDDVIITQNEP